MHHESGRGRHSVYTITWVVPHFGLLLGVHILTSNRRTSSGATTNPAVYLGFSFLIVLVKKHSFTGRPVNLAEPFLNVRYAG